MTSGEWKSRPILGGLVTQEAEWELRERPARGYAPVATRATAAVIPDMDWRENGVLWGVIFHRYSPQNPLQARLKRNETTGEMIEIPPPPAIEERKINGRLPVAGDDKNALGATMREARKLCEETVRAGRPTR